MTDRRCASCGGPIALGSRADRVTCSAACRQAAHRAARAAAPVTPAPVTVPVTPVPVTVPVAPPGAARWIADSDDGLADPLGHWTGIGAGDDWWR